MYFVVPFTLFNRAVYLCMHSCCLSLVLGLIAIGRPDGQCKRTIYTKVLIFNLKNFNI